MKRYVSILAVLLFLLFVTCQFIGQRGVRADSSQAGEFIPPAYSLVPSPKEEGLKQHFYNVIFDPDVYPLNWALADGRVSEEYYREEHELDYERMISEVSEKGDDQNHPEGQDKIEISDYDLSPMSESSD